MLDGTMTLPVAVRLTFLGGLLLAGCGKESSSSGGGSQPTGAPAADPASRIARKRPSKDRGEASMKLGDAAWTADRAKARLKDNTLVIRASRMGKVGDTMQRDELHLAVDNFHGPGEYTATMSGSRFIRVGINTSEAATGSDKDVTDEAVKAISGSKHLMLSGAKITVTVASASEVTGTFAWQSPRAGDSPISDGSFRAIVD